MVTRISAAAVERDGALAALRAQAGPG
jgi:hypothetical protein